MRHVAILAAIAAAGSSMMQGAARVIPREIFYDEPPLEPARPKYTARRDQARWKFLSAAERKKLFVRKDRAGDTLRAYRQPHTHGHYVAIVRTAEGKRHHQCGSYEAALAHKPYAIEYVNGFGQVKFRENFERLARAEATLQAVVGLLGR